MVGGVRGREEGMVEEGEGRNVGDSWPGGTDIVVVFVVVVVVLCCCCCCFMLLLLFYVVVVVVVICLLFVPQVTK